MPEVNLWNKALDILSRREHSISQLKSKIQKFQDNEEQVEELINKLIKTNQNVNIIVYDENSNAPNLMKKYDQLISLGFINVFLYPGGLFEWLLLQDIYGYENFPTTKQETDILKFKGKSIFNNYYLTNSID